MFTATDIADWRAKVEAKDKRIAELEERLKCPNCDGKGNESCYCDGAGSVDEAYQLVVVLYLKERKRAKAAELERDFWNKSDTTRAKINVQICSERNETKDELRKAQKRAEQAEAERYEAIGVADHWAASDAVFKEKYKQAEAQVAVLVEAGQKLLNDICVDEPGWWPVQASVENLTKTLANLPAGEEKLLEKVAWFDRNAGGHIHPGCNYMAITTCTKCGWSNPDKNPILEDAMNAVTGERDCLAGENERLREELKELTRDIMIGVSKNNVDGSPDSPGRPEPLYGHATKKWAQAALAPAPEVPTACPGCNRILNWRWSLGENASGYQHEHKDQWVDCEECTIEDGKSGSEPEAPKCSHCGSAMVSSQSEKFWVCPFLGCPDPDSKPKAREDTP